MKYIKRILILLALLVPLSVNALENPVDTASDEFTIIVEDEVKTTNDVNGSSVFVGNNVVSTNKVDGINMLFGNSVAYQGESEYLLLAGNIVDLSGIIYDDGFIFGNLVTLKENFKSNRDLFIFATELELNGTISRDVTIFASNVKLGNVQILGNVNINATNLEIGDNAIISGTLSHNEDIEKTISQNSQINEIKVTESLIKEVEVKDLIYTHVVNYASIMLIFVVLAFVFPQLFRKISETNKEISLTKFFSLFGFGALILIAVPMLAITLMSTVIGTTLALLILGIYIILVCLTNIFFGYLIGYIIWKKFIKKEENILLIGLIGITLTIVLSVIPVIGDIIAVLSLMVGLGIVFNMFKKSE